MAHPDTRGCTSLLPSGQAPAREPCPPSHPRRTPTEDAAKEELSNLPARHEVKLRVTGPSTESPAGSSRLPGYKGQAEGAQHSKSRRRRLSGGSQAASPLLSRALDAPQAMLLLLTLALLGSRPCWAAQQYGLGGGLSFSTSGSHNGEITGLRVFIGGVNNIRGIQVKFGDSWDDRRGASGGMSQELLLWSGEHITEIHGSFDLLLHYLAVCTDLRGCVSFGKNIGKQFSAFPSQQGQVLTGIFGQYGLLGLKGIGFTWDFPAEGDTTPTEEDTTATEEDNTAGDDDRLIWQ
ncbi:PREDICTED: zymogen granule protein 16 homolog B [Propithecus coquereli]|uniref:zymogen granule protein 16 homolog B n=1 Tax=Propithecus coquereli TaxID=379532 RepID=UPI00063EFA90|nr:PREDICTED: zymogen granule protein 16 homolog B [Propithecus coquereli]